MSRRLLAVAPLAWLLALGGAGAQGAGGAGAADRPSPTIHPPLPPAGAEFWLTPSDEVSSAAKGLARAVALIADGKPERAAPLVRKQVEGRLEPYQQYYLGVALQSVGESDDAGRILRSLAQSAPTPYLRAQARLRAGEVAEALKDAGAAAKTYEPLTRVKTAEPDDIWMRLGRARLAAGDREKAVEAFAQVYYEFPLSTLAEAAADQIGNLNAWPPLEPGSPRYDLEVGRAERLFAARRYTQAREAFELVRPHARGDDAERVALRLAECDYHLRRYPRAQAALEPFTRDGKRQAEARFYHLLATRGRGDHPAYVRQVRALLEDFPSSSWAEDALDHLGTHYILVDEDETAEGVFRELLARYPAGRHAPRAAWKTGWAAYRAGRHEEAAAIFERAAARFARSDYRPAWLYWAARAHEKLGDEAAARRVFGIVIADYLNSYYGRLASRVLTAKRVEPLQLAAAVAPTAPDAVPAAAPQGETPFTETVRALLGAGLYDDAIGELQWALRNEGESPLLRATLGLAYARRGDLRPAINAIKRAYPQYLSTSGSDLPLEVRQVLFPVAYWDLITSYAERRRLDPYLLAALMAQESTFDADIRSSANAIGLMQIVPSTGRRYGRRLGVRRYSTARLTNPEVNVIIGTQYLADLIERFGSVHLALASYNAGPSAAARWAAERPGVDRDEFIDDIPYPETQLYVKKILGTAEDYRELYGELGVPPLAGPPGTGGAATSRASK